MQYEPKPLFSLTIAEYMALTRQLVEDIITEKLKGKEGITTDEKTKEDVFNIGDLMAFLRCSKASVHNYKKMGMPFYRVGRKILFRKQEVLNFMKGLKSKLKKD